LSLASFLPFLLVLVSFPRLDALARLAWLLAFLAREERAKTVGCVAMCRRDVASARAVSRLASASNIRSCCVMVSPGTCWPAWRRRVRKSVKVTAQLVGLRLGDPRRRDAGRRRLQEPSDLNEPHVRGRPDGLSHGAPGHPELACQLLVGRKPRPGLAFPGQNQVPQPHERVVGDAQLSPSSSDIR
jgi:hypothetical protein